MNRILKVVFSRAKGMFVVVSELGRACSKGSLKSVLVAAPMVLATMPVYAQGQIQNDQYGIAISENGQALAKAPNDSNIAIGVDSATEEVGSIAIGSSFVTTPAGGGGDIISRSPSNRICISCYWFGKFGERW